MTNEEIYNTKAFYNKFLLELTAIEKHIILELMQEAIQNAEINEIKVGVSYTDLQGRITGITMESTKPSK